MTQKTEIFIERIVGGGFEINVDGWVASFRTKAEAADFVDQAVCVAQDLGSFYKIYDMDKLA